MAPLSPGESQTQGESQAQGRRLPRARRWATAKKVLVVNDHVEVRSLITEFLRRRGFIAIPVRDADSARVICERIALDLILLHVVDLNLSETTLIRQAKLLHPGTPIVVVSAVVTPELERECRVLGGSEVLQKPLVLRRLERVIARLLRPSSVTSS